MKSLNRVMLIGHLAADVDLKQTKNGRAVANFTLATNRTVLDEDSKKKEIADFHRIIAWGKLAEISSKYLAKGVAVLVEGRIVNRSFEDKDGNRHYRTEIVMDNLNILTWKKSKSGTNQIDIAEVSDGSDLQVESQLEKDTLVAA